MNRTLSGASTIFTVVVVGLLGSSLSATAARPVPFKGKAALMVTGATPTEDGLQLTAIATGQATHLGPYTRTETVVVDDFGQFEGSITFIADNGDELWVDVFGGFTALDLSTAEGVYIFAGGTGRFEDASGSALFDAVASDTGYDVTFDGKIQY